MKSIDTYQSLCTDVYDLSKPTAPKDAYQFYRSYAAQAQGKILEPMCGTGRYLIPLFEEGFDICGFDASQHMLARFGEKAQARNVSPEVWHGYIEDMNPAEKYKLIFIPCGSFGLITEVESIKRSLKLIYNHLDDGGLFVFEVETLHAVPKELGIWRGSKWQRDDGSAIILSHLASIDGDMCCSTAKYELINNNQILGTEIEEYKIRIYDDSQLLLSLLAEAGFSHVRLVKAFERHASPSEWDESLVYECEK